MARMAGTADDAATSTASPTGSTDTHDAATRVDLLVIGGGIIGLATARELANRYPARSISLVEKERELASHQSSHNSGVIHAGLYYPPGSLKARLCREGKAAVERYATERGIPFDICGKLVIAIGRDEMDRFDALRLRAEANGIPGLEILGPSGIRDHEPHAIGHAALWSPTTGIIDYGAVAESFGSDLATAGVGISLGERVESMSIGAQQVHVTTDRREIAATHVVVCAGLHADRVAEGTDPDAVDRIIPFRGDYYTLTEDARPLVRGLIYPVPDPEFPFLGVHLSRTIAGDVVAGPNAVLALAREGYRRSDLDLREAASIIGHRGFRRLARRYWKTGLAEMWRDVSRRAYLRELQRYVPEIQRDQLIFGPSGVRAQAIDPDGTLVEDFRLGGGDRVLHVRNAPSPAATASMAIATTIADEADRRFGFGP